MPKTLHIIYNKYKRTTAIKLPLPFTIWRMLNIPLILLSSTLWWPPPEVWTGGFTCLNNPCVHGVCIDDQNATFVCYCIDGYTGMQCQTNWNECWSSPCQNGAVCIDGVAVFNCSCAPGFVGDLCELNVNECASDPCQNNGTCLDGTNGYSCVCPPGYLGVHCEIDISVCNTSTVPGDESRCLNGGVCIDGPGDTFTCQCRSGWYGAHCAEETDECLSNPCQNGAVCVDLLGEYACACVNGYSGHNCELSIERCNENNCLNNAICLVEDGSPQCYCVPDFHGDLCQYQYNECLLGDSKCLNGGTCIDGIDGFTCSCPPSSTGLYCECTIINDGTMMNCDGALVTIQETVTTLVTSTIKVDVEFETTSTTNTFDSDTATTSTTTTVESNCRTLANPNIESYSRNASSFDLSTTTPLSSTTVSEITTTNLNVPIETVTNTISVDNGTVDESIGSILTEIMSTTTQSVSLTEFDSYEKYNRTESDADVQTTIDTTTITSHSYLFTSTPQEELEETSSTTMISTEEIQECYESFCQNGGICRADTKGIIHCECPFDASGEFCENQTLIREAAFEEQSFILHEIDVFKSISLCVNLKTLANDGAIVHIYVDINTFLLIYMDGGRLNCLFSCGHQTMRLSEIRTPINDGTTMEICAQLNFSTDSCTAFTKLNNEYTLSGQQQFNLFEQHIFLTKGRPKTAFINFGYAPNNAVFRAHYPLDLKWGVPGCLWNLMFSKEAYDIFQGATNASGITECHSIACLAKPCKNSGICFEVVNNYSNSTTSQWRCNCSNGYTGLACENSVCDNNPCLSGGTCIPFLNNTYICLCPFGRHGQFCESYVHIAQPYFASTIHGFSSYLAYSLLTSTVQNISEHLELAFRFVPTTLDQISLVLFMGQVGKHGWNSDHFAVTFVRGYLMLTWNLGSGSRRIFTSKPINPFATDCCRIKLRITEQSAWLYVEDFENITGRALGQSTGLNVLPILYAGGHNSANFESLPHDLPLHSGFLGCIHDVQLTVSGGLSIELNEERIMIGRAIGECGVPACSERSCQHDGMCLHHASSFMCVCQDKWQDPICSSAVNPCEFGYHNCSLGSTCVPLIGHYECDCPVGVSGKHCEHRLNSTQGTYMSFTGIRSYLALKPLEFHYKQFQIEFEIRTDSNEGLVYYSHLGEVQHICLFLQENRLQLIHQSNTESPFSVVLNNTNPLIKGLWYQIKFGKLENQLYLSVNDSISTIILKWSPMVSNNLSTGFIYLGGLSDLSNVPFNIQLFTNNPAPFKGCLHQVRINNNGSIIMLKQIEIGRNVFDSERCEEENRKKTRQSTSTPHFTRNSFLMVDQRRLAFNGRNQ